MPAGEIILPVRHYDLAATLDSGQAFRWRRAGPAWTGVVGGRWVRLTAVPGGIHAQTTNAGADWDWLADYLQSGVDLTAILQSFPSDPPMQAAVAACPGLRLLRQDPWECLASFMLSSTKQIVQIRQIITLLCERHGPVIDTPPGVPAAHAFPAPDRLAALSEAQLRDCKMGFRAPNVLAAARRIHAGEFDLERVRTLSREDARAELMRLAGVGRKIADCVLLFAYGFNAAFPVDVWIKKALQELYFPRRRASEKQLHRFAATHFGPHGGYAQQYLFHYMRTRKRPDQTV